MDDRNIATDATFIPGIEKNGKPLSSMNLAVIKYRNDCVQASISQVLIPPNPVDYKRNLVERTFFWEGGQLKNFQVTGIGNAIDILKEYRAVVIADDMGLGKTIEAIVLARMVAVKRILYVVPANTLVQWQAQIYKWSGDAATWLKNKKQTASVTAMNLPGTYICSYEMLDSIDKNVSRWDMIVYDELHKLRSRNTKTSLAARDLRNRAEYVVGLTGTLQWGYTRDLWNPLRCLFYYRFGTADEFDFTYCGAFINEHGGKDNKGFKSSDGIDRSAELGIRLSYVSIRRTRRDVAAELPAFERKIIRIPCTEKAKTALNGYLTKQLKYAHAIMSTGSEKIDVVIDWIEGKENAIVFTWTKQDVVVLAAKINALGKPVYMITGDTSKAERETILVNAAREKASIVATIDSIGVGVDGLQHVSSDVIFHTLSPKPKLHLQAESRLFRIGAKNAVTCTYVVMTDSADELVISLLLNKSQQDTDKSGEQETVEPFKNLNIDDELMRKTLDEWVKNATDDINEGMDDWDDSEDEE